jgi:hypothetical protein
MSKNCSETVLTVHRRTNAVVVDQNSNQRSKLLHYILYASIYYYQFISSDCVEMGKSIDFLCYKMGMDNNVNGLVLMERENNLGAVLHLQFQGKFLFTAPIIEKGTESPRESP